MSFTVQTLADSSSDPSQIIGSSCVRFWIHAWWTADF